MKRSIIVISILALFGIDAFCFEGAKQDDTKQAVKKASRALEGTWKQPPMKRERVVEDKDWPGLGANAQLDPLGGQPLPGATQSVSDLEAQVAYHRAFEAVVWAMPASFIYRFRQGLLAVPGVEDNVIISFSGTLKTKHETITPNTAVPYITAVSDLQNGPVVLEVPANPHFSRAR